MTPRGLRTLLNVESIEEFMAGHWPDKMFVGKGPVERLAGLADYDFEALVAMKKARTRAFFRTVEGQASSVDVAAGQERGLYDAGFTMYFHNLTCPGITEWIDALDSELGTVRGVTRVAAFASRRGLGLKPHYDQNDNFICQARGKKRWRIAPNTHVKFPTVGYMMGSPVTAAAQIEAPDGFPTELPEPFETIDTEPGTVVFMPRGVWHDTETVDSESLHFNVQSGLATWKDALEYILTQTSVLHAEELRAPIMDLFDGNTPREGFEEELKTRLRDVVDTICNGQIALSRAGFHRYIMGRRGK